MLPGQVPPESPFQPQATGELPPLLPFTVPSPMPPRRTCHLNSTKACGACDQQRPWDGRSVWVESPLCSLPHPAPSSSHLGPQPFPNKDRIGGQVMPPPHPAIRAGGKGSLFPEAPSTSTNKGQPEGGGEGNNTHPTTLPSPLLPSQLGGGPTLGVGTWAANSSNRATATNKIF